MKYINLERNPKKVLEFDFLCSKCGARHQAHYYGSYNYGLKCQGAPREPGLRCKCWYNGLRYDVLCESTIVGLEVPEYLTPNNEISRVLFGAAEGIDYE